jgi:acetolactate synthase-1/2/3 large subunit
MTEQGPQAHDFSRGRDVKETMTEQGPQAHDFSRGRDVKETITGHSGELALVALERWCGKVMFTLSGGHVFPLYDAASKRGWRIVDVRHEQTAGWAAEAMAKLTRRPGLAVLTAGPGVTNGVSAITTAHFNGSPMVVLAGRAPQGRWGSGSLQEIDHLPLVAPVTKAARTITSPDQVFREVYELAKEAATPHRGPVFADIPIDVIFSSATVPLEPVDHGEGGRAGEGATSLLSGDPPDPDALAEAAAVLKEARRPVMVAGGDVWAGGAENELLELVEEANLPTFTNGQGRGCLPADHRLALARVRAALGEADVVVVVGTPLDFRLSFGRFGKARVVHLVDHASRVAGHVTGAVSVAGDLATSLSWLAQHAGGGSGDRKDWAASLADRERTARAAEEPLLSSDATPIHPMRLYGELRRQLERDAVVVGDGGDFVSFAGKLIDSYTPGCWLDPGPYGCLGTALGYLAAARLARPSSQVVALIGDGAFGFSGMDVDTLVRHRLPVVMVVGNNGIWGLEKHPMKALYGYDVAADLQPGCRYDEVVRALGGAGETVADPEDIAPALRRAFESGVPYLVNVLCDPEVVYPRSSNLA